MKTQRLIASLTIALGSAWLTHATNISTVAHVSANAIATNAPTLATPPSAPTPVSPPPVAPTAAAKPATEAAALPTPTPVPTPAPPPRPTYPRELNPPWAFFRGCVNLSTCWLELPRNLVIENVNFPVLGIGSGLLKGLFFMTSRAVLGVVDVMMFGMTGPSAFSPDLFPEFVFAAQWSPYAPPAPGEESLQVEFEEEEAVEENMETPY
ncbi:MAG: hypothetical protein N2595_06200 [bacterium]|nr:hypothetical protein [bacterium]